MNSIYTASVGSDEETVNKMKLFGEKVGIAFQIKDDLFDYGNSTLTGKPNGIDIKEQKMTLPLIYFFGMGIVIFNNINNLTLFRPV